MAKNEGPTVIKKYANRRLYNTGTSSYVTLDDLAVMVKKGEDFSVQDAKTGEDITHSVLTQIIFEQESKTGNTLLPISFLRQLISYYGDQMQMVLPSYLEQSMAAFSAQQEQMREQLAKAFGNNPMARNMQIPMQMAEEQVRRNTEMFQKALKMFTPFGMDSGVGAAGRRRAQGCRCQGSRRIEGPASRAPDQARTPSAADRRVAGAASCRAGSRTGRNAEEAGNEMPAFVGRSAKAMFRCGYADSFGVRTWRPRYMPDLRSM